MINLAILRKTFRDSLVLIAACALGIIGFVVLFVWAMLNMGPELMNFVSQFNFLRRLFAAMGINVDGEISINVLFSASFTHAMVMILSWSVVIATSTRTLVGEMERGTADLLMTLPVSRSEIYLSTSLVWIIASAVLGTCPLIGVWLGTVIFEIQEPIQIGRYIAPAVNLFALLVTIGGLSSLISCLVSRRGHAVAAIVGIGVVSMLLNFLEPFIQQIERIRYLGLLNFFRPVDVVRTNEWPVSDIFVLLVFGIVCWLVGMLIFVRKDVPTA